MKVTQDMGDVVITYDTDNPSDITREYKAGTPGANRAAQLDQLTDARATFRSNFTQWATMNAAQKDAANRQAQRAIAVLISYVINDMSDSGNGGQP